MTKLEDIIRQHEGRRLEFKAKMPSKADIYKAIIAFANDAGGTMYIGISDNPREIIGIDESKLTEIEEQLSNIIHYHCEPVILPEISFIRFHKKNLIKV